MSQTLIRDWMDAHGINYAVAQEAGCYGTRQYDEETLFAPYHDANGEVFYRTRVFKQDDDSAPWKQPKGESLRLFWPLGEAKGLPVLLCEGEGDALCAASVLYGTDTNTVPELLDAICPVGLPGASMNPVAVVASLVLAECPQVFILLDGDEAGRKATDKIVQAAAKVALETVPVYLPAGSDLSEHLGWNTDGDPKLEVLGNLLLDAEAYAEGKRESIVMGSIKSKLNINQTDAGAFNG